jgi:hypothetical protein
MSSRPWFVRRKIGIGWRPATWEGWLITVVFAGAAFAGLASARLAKTPIGIIAVVALAGLYAAVAALTGRRTSATAVEPEPLLPSVPATAATAAPPDRRTQAAPVSRPPALIVDGLTKRFRERVAFADVSFTVGAGEQRRREDRVCVARRGCADCAEHRGVQLIDVVSCEPVDGNVTDGWDNVMLRVEVVCTPRLRAPCTSPQGQPLGEPIADRGGQSSPPFRSGCLSFTSSLGERPAVHAVLSAADAEADFPAVAPFARAPGTSPPSFPGRCHVACLLDRWSPAGRCSGSSSMQSCLTPGESSF